MREGERKDLQGTESLQYQSSYKLLIFSKLTFPFLPLICCLIPRYHSWPLLSRSLLFVEDLCIICSLDLKKITPNTECVHYRYSETLSSFVWTPYFHDYSQRLQAFGQVLSLSIPCFLWVNILRSFSSEYCQVKRLPSCTSSSDFWKQSIYIDMDQTLSC